MQFLQGHSKIQVGVQTTTKEVLEFKVNSKRKLLFQISSETVHFTAVESATESCCAQASKE